jgi:hypothetical protein
VGRQAFYSEGLVEGNVKRGMIISIRNAFSRMRRVNVKASAYALLVHYNGQQCGCHVNVTV